MIENTTDWAMPDQRSLENPTTPLSDPDEWLLDMLGGGKSSSGIVVNDETILTYSPIVRGVNLIANAVAKLPTVVVKRLPEGGKEPDPSHFAYELARWEPNEEDVAFVFKQTMQSQALLRGNAYAFIDRLPNGNASAMIPLPSRNVWPVRMDGMKWYMFDTGSEIRRLEAMNVLHIRGLGLDTLLGLDTTNKASDSVGLGLAMQKYSGKFFANNARPSVVIEMEGKPEEADIKVLRENWAKMHTGLENSHRVALLYGGMKLNPFSAGAKDSQLIESRQFSLVDVANWLNVPVHKVGGEGRTAFASLEQENRSFIDDTIAPWITTWEQELRKKLLTESEKASDSHLILFKMVALLAADVKTVSEVLTSEVNNGLLTVDEARAIQDRPPLPNGEGKRFRKPENIGFIDDVEEEEPEPVDDPDDEDEDRDQRMQRAACEAVANDAARMARRLGVHARKASRDVDNLEKWLETVEAEHRQKVVETLGPPVELLRLAYGCPEGPAGTAKVKVINAAVNSIFRGVRESIDARLASKEPDAMRTLEASVDADMTQYEQEAAYYVVEAAKKQSRSKQWDGDTVNNVEAADR